MQSCATSITQAMPNLAAANSESEVASRLKGHYEMMQNKLGDYHGPMTCNLLSSFRNKNSLADSTEYKHKRIACILRGVHLFNQQQLQAGKGRVQDKKNSLWYVQTMAVTQTTSSEDKNVLAETELMNEMSMLKDFSAQALLLPPAMSIHLVSVQTKVQEQYHEFLTCYQQGGIYFKDSDQGKAANNMIADLKEYLRNNSSALKVNKNASLMELAQKVLLKLMSMDKHQEKSCVQLLQPLSIFIQYASLVGGKRGSSKYLAVTGMLDLLKDIDASMRRGADFCGEEDSRRIFMDAMHAFLNGNETLKCCSLLQYFLKASNLSALIMQIMMKKK